MPTATSTKKLAQVKTKETDASVEDFINGIKDETKRKDSFTLVKLMEKATKAKAKLWGSGIIGFGNLIYESPTSGRQVEWFKIGFAPRKANISLYTLPDFKEREVWLKKLGKHKTGGGCVYINKLEDVDLKTLEGMLRSAAKQKS
jgi:uncharacterized protein DUF1801